MLERNEIQVQNVLFLLDNVIVPQNKVRNCIIEGMVWDVETALSHAVSLGLITNNDFQHLTHLLHLPPEESKSES